MTSHPAGAKSGTTVTKYYQRPSKKSSAIGDYIEHSNIQQDTLCVCGLPGSTIGQELPCQCRRRKRWGGAWSLGWEDPLKDGMAIHSSIPAWRIPHTKEPGGLQFIGSQWVKHNWKGLGMHIKVFMSACVQCPITWWKVATRPGPLQGWDWWKVKVFIHRLRSGEGRESFGKLDLGILKTIWLIHVEVWQKTVRCCKAIILQQ